MKAENSIRNWLMSFPSTVVSDSPKHVFEKALDLFKVQTATDCDLDFFTDSLWRYGYKPEQVGHRWQLALPAKSLGDPGHYRRLRNTVG